MKYLKNPLECKQKYNLVQYIVQIPEMGQPSVREQFRCRCSGYICLHRERIQKPQNSLFWNISAFTILQTLKHAHQNARWILE